MMGHNRGMSKLSRKYTHPQEYSVALWKETQSTVVTERCFAWGKVRSTGGAVRALIALAKKEGLLAVGEPWQVDVSADASFDYETHKGITK